MSEEKALSMGYKPKAVMKAWTYVAVDPFEELLLGPTFATEKVLRMAGLTLGTLNKKKYQSFHSFYFSFHVVMTRYISNDIAF